MTVVDEKMELRREIRRAATAGLTGNRRSVEPGVLQAAMARTTAALRRLARAMS